jgi:hypothetical protein
VRKAGTKSLINEMKPMDLTGSRGAGADSLFFAANRSLLTIAALLAGVVCKAFWRLQFASALRRLECEWLWAQRPRASFV